MIQKIVATCEMRCVGFHGMLWTFVTTLQDVQKIVAIVMRCVGFRGCYALFVTTLWLPNEDFGMSKNMCSRPFVSTFHTLNYSIWSKSSSKCLQNVWGTYFSTYQNLRLGSINFARCTKDSSNCDAMCWFSGMRLSFCNNFARWLQKIVATCDAMCWFFWDAMFFCNNFARWLQEIVAIVMRCVGGMLLSFCNNFARWLQKIVL